MSYLQFNDFYRQLLLSGKLPYPHYYPYVSQVPNLSNPGPENLLVQPPNYFDYNANHCYDQETGQCHNPNHFQCNNLSYKDRDPSDEKYDYYFYDMYAYQDPCCALGFCTQILISNTSVPAPSPTVPINIPPTNLDTNLLDPWGLLMINNIIWIANRGSGMLTSYDLTGKPLPKFINVFGPFNNVAQPTGIVSNPDFFSFPIIGGSKILSANILVATRDGTVNGYNPNMDPGNSFILINNFKNNSVYTGMEIVDASKYNAPISGFFIYLADFYNQKIDVYDGNLFRLDMPFLDEWDVDPIPEDYAPFNIINIEGCMYVMYARQGPCDNQFEFPGPGFGYINVFTLDGLFVRRFASRGMLNAPWGIMLTPSWFGYPSGSLLISNFGDGTINICGGDGKFLGKLKDGCLHDICVPGIRAIVENPFNIKTLWWTASTENFMKADVGTIGTSK